MSQLDEEDNIALRIRPGVPDFGASVSEQTCKNMSVGSTPTKNAKIKNMKIKILSPAIILTSMLLPLCVGAQTILINPTTRNGSFELVDGGSGSTEKVNFSTGRVDSWAIWTAFPNTGDTGTDDSGAASNGARDAFFQGDSGAYNLTGHTIQQGDVFTYTWDWVLNGRGPAIAQLGYWNGSSVVLIAGTASSAPGGGTGVLLSLGTNYTVMAGDPATGSPIVMTVHAPNGANYPEVDNFVLTVLPGGSTSAPFVVADTTVIPSTVFGSGSVQMSATFNGTPPITYQWKFDNGSGPVAISGATNTTYSIASAQLANSGSYFVTASNAISPFTTNSSPVSLLVVSSPQINTNLAGILDATSSAPTAGAHDIAQLVTAPPTAVPGINYYVNNGAPPGQTFTTLAAAPNGYQLSSIYMQEELSTAGGGGLDPATYTLGIYSVSGNNAVLITSYVSTNAPTIVDGNWIQWVGLTNVLATNKTYAFSIHKDNGTGWWKLGNNSTATDLYGGGQAALLPGNGLGAMTFSTDTTIDAGFLVSLAPWNGVSTTPTSITSFRSGNNLTLSWPADHTGWRLQSQTNSLSIGLTTNWGDVAGSESTNQVTIPIIPGVGSLFLRMVYP